MYIYINGRFLTQSITGVQRYAHELLKALDVLYKQGDIDNSKLRFKILAPAKGILHNMELNNIPLHKVGYLSGQAWEQLELPYYSRDGILFCPGNTAPLFSLISKQRTVVTIHSLSYLYCPETYSITFRSLYKTIIPLVLRFSNAVITVSQSERNTILGRYNHSEKRLYAIQNGGLPNDLSHSQKGSIANAVSANLPFILYVGSLSKSKNIQGVLKALAILNNKFDLHIVIAGGKDNIFSNQLLNSSDKLESKIHFIGQIINTADLVHLYKTASCLVFPSFYEASPLPPIEAMALGCPVIASSIPSLKERCADAAYYVDPANVEDIATGIHKVLTDKPLRQRMIQNGFSRAKIFTWEKTARDHLNVFEKVINS